MIPVGNTPLIKLNRMSEPGCADIYVKYEGGNPTGSMKDRMALSGGDTTGTHRLEGIGAGKRIVTIICDSGLKYLQGDLYK